LKWR